MRLVFVRVAAAVCLASLGAPLVQAGAPAAPAAGPASSGELTAEVLKSVDDLLARAEFAAENLETAAAGGTDGSGCPKDVTPRGIAADVNAGKLPKELAGVILAAIVQNGEQWELYHACAAYALKDPGLCAEMLTTDPPLPPKQVAEHPETTMRGRCSAFASILPVYRAYDSKDPSFVDKCAALAPTISGLTSAEALRKSCQAWAAYKGDPDDFVDAYSLVVSPAPSRQEALDTLAKLTGDPKLCETQTYPSRKAVCRERAAFQRAMAAKDKAACKGPLCRALMGEPAVVCDVYAVPVKKAACRAFYGPRYAEERTRDFQRYADEAVAALANKGLESLASLKAVNERLDRLFQARARLDAAVDKIAPKIIVAKGAPQK